MLGHAVKESTMFRAMDEIARPCYERGYHVYTAMDEITRPCCERGYNV